MVAHLISIISVFKNGPIFIRVKLWAVFNVRHIYRQIVCAVARVSVSVCVRERERGSVLDLNRQRLKLLGRFLPMTLTFDTRK